MIENWNFQGLFLLQKGSFQPNFTKIWYGHHGNLENIGWFDLEWPFFVKIFNDFNYLSR